ncbi:MAG: rhodanese-like domain-containing protein [Gemmataceae bacterium]
MSKRFIAFAALVAAIPSLFAADHTTDSVDAVRKALASGNAVLLDVREKSEWDSGHLKDAGLLPLSYLRKSPKAEDVAKVAAKEKVIYLHCGSGIRCLQAADVLKKMGYDVRPLKEGFRDLVEAGFSPAK